MEQGNNVATEIGSGQAQVFRPNDLSYIDRAIAQQNVDKRRKREEENQRLGEVSKGLSSLHKLDIFHAHQPYFADKSKELYDKTARLAPKIKAGDYAAKAEVEKDIADLQTEAVLSKHYREQVGEIGKELIKNKDSYTPESHDYYQELNKKIDPSKFKEGEGIDYNIDPTRIQKEISAKELLNYAQDIKQKNRKTGGYYKDPKTGQNVNTHTEGFSRSDADEVVDSMLKDPIVYAQYSRDANRIKDPAEKMLYMKSDGTLDVGKYAQDKMSPNLMYKSETTATASGGGKSGMEINIGEGSASNELYDFTAEEKMEPDLPSGTPGGPVKKGEVVREITVSPKKNTTIKFQGLPDPEDPNVSVNARIDRFVKRGNGKIVAIGQMADGSEYVNDYEKIKNSVTGDIKTNWDELVKGGIFKRGVAESGDINKVSPKKIKIGDVVGGFRFKGGNPNDQKNWTK